MSAWRVRWFPGIVCVLAGAMALAISAPAGEPTSVDEAAKTGLETFADRVAAAVAAGDDARLSTLIDGLRGDPWLVADVLLWQARPEAARAFAAASAHPSFGGLDAYVAGSAPADVRIDIGPLLALRERAVEAVAAGDVKASLALFHEAAERLARPGGVLGISLRIGRGRALALSRRSEEARPILEAAVREAESAGWLRGAADAYDALGICAQEPLDRERLVDAYTRVATLSQRVGDDVGASEALANLSVTHAAFGDYASALPSLERASELLTPHAADPANAFDLAHLLMTQGSVHARLGESANAAAALERSLRLMPVHDEGVEIVQIRLHLAFAYRSLGDFRRATAHLDALEASPLIAGRGLALASILTERGHLAYDEGQWAPAHELFEKAHALLLEEGTVEMVLGLELDLWRAARELGRVKEAEAGLRSVLERMEASEDRSFTAFGLAELGVARCRLGRYVEAIAAHEQGIRAAEELGQLDESVSNRTGIARAELGRGNYAAAMAAARAAIVRLPDLIRHATAAQAPAARARRSEVYTIGAQAALAADDASALCYFIESGRAGALLETLRAREGFAAAVVPEALREARLRSRRERADAQAAVRDAHQGRAKRSEIRARRAALRAAQERERDVATQIELESRLGVSILYPHAAELSAIQAAVEPGQVLVLYRLLPDTSVALVIPAGDAPARIVRLAKAATIAAACEEALAVLQDPASSWEEPVARLRAVVVEPLGLAVEVETVIVSPDGPLALVPHTLLVGDRDVVLVPSGTTRLALRAMPRRGGATLGVGNPVYDRASRLSTLPGTRAEIGALPDPAIRLLGSRATVAGFRAALASKPGWRSVHLACHGLVDEDPWESSLALTPGEGDDGLLRALDVVGLSVPADLVVLSACDSGRATTIEGEGAVGLTHAFLCAGAPRVVVGLWKVDDEATRALMRSFYEAWDDEYVSVAAALGAARRAVRGEAQWSHPYYWAAWISWGLAD